VTRENRSGIPAVAGTRRSRGAPPCNGQSRHARDPTHAASVCTGGGTQQRRRPPTPPASTPPAGRAVQRADTNPNKRPSEGRVRRHPTVAAVRVGGCDTDGSGTPSVRGNGRWGGLPRDTVGGEGRPPDTLRRPAHGRDQGGGGGPCSRSAAPPLCWPPAPPGGARWVAAAGCNPGAATATRRRPVNTDRTRSAPPPSPPPPAAQETVGGCASGHPVRTGIQIVQKPSWREAVQRRWGAPPRLVSAAVRARHPPATLARISGARGYPRRGRAALPGHTPGTRSTRADAGCRSGQRHTPPAPALCAGGWGWWGVV